MSISGAATQSALVSGVQSKTLEQMIDVAVKAAAAKAKEPNATEGDAVDAGKSAAAVSADGGAGPVPSSPLAQLVTYIPTETLAIYIAVIAAMGDVQAPNGVGQTVAEADFTSRWWVLAAISLATFVLTLGLSYRSQKTVKVNKVTFPWFECFATTVAFVVWAIALPSTPLRDFHGFAYETWSPVIILVGSVSIAAAAYIFGKTIAWQKVPGTGL